MSVDPSVIAASTGMMAAGGPQQATRSLGYRASLQDIARFENAFNTASNAVKSTAVDKTAATESLQSLLGPLINLNKHSNDLRANVGSTIDNDMKPSELMLLTMHAQEFMFHCQLTANVANRSSDGVQQLFRQQS